MFKTGTSVYRKPTKFLTVLFYWEDGRVQVMDGRGGASWAMDPDELRAVPTLVSEEDARYWEKVASSKEEFMKSEHARRETRK